MTLKAMILILIQQVISDKLTSWEANCRYSDEIIATKEDVVNAYNYAKDFYNELIKYEKNHLLKISNEDNSFKNLNNKIIYRSTNIPLNEQEEIEIDNINNDSKEENDNLEDDYELQNIFYW